MHSRSACAANSNLPLPATMLNSSRGQILACKFSAPLLYQCTGVMMPAACASTAVIQQSICSFVRACMFTFARQCMHVCQGLQFQFCLARHACMSTHHKQTEPAADAAASTLNAAVHADAACCAVITSSFAFVQCQATLTSQMWAIPVWHKLL